MLKYKELQILNMKRHIYQFIMEYSVSSSQKKNYKWPILFEKVFCIFNQQGNKNLNCFEIPKPERLLC